MRNALAYVPECQHSMVAAALRQAFLQPDRAAAAQTWRQVADQMRRRWPKLSAFIDGSEADVLAHMDFPDPHRSKIHSTDALDKGPCRRIASFFPVALRRVHPGVDFGALRAVRLGGSDQALTNRV